MTTRAALLLGICVGASLPLIAKTLRPLSVYALAGGMIAYETICDALESSKETLLKSGDEASRGR